MGRDLVQWAEHLPAVHRFPSLQPVPHGRYTSGRGMYYALYGIVHIKFPFLSVEKRVFYLAVYIVRNRISNANIIEN